MNGPRGKGGDRRRKLGAAGEKFAAQYLSSAGLRVVERNWRCALGEVDLIAQQGETLIFVEVRTRSASSAGRFGAPEQSVDERKQRKLRTLAQTYMIQCRIGDVPVRFDVVAIWLGPADELIHLAHYEEAF